MLNRLFSPTKEFNDGLSQPQREAMVDLLHFCMFADNLVALSETKFIAAEVHGFNWAPNISFEYYQGKSIGAVRAALESAEGKQHLLASIAQRLETKEARKQAFALCQKLFLSDGAKATTEFAAQGEVRKALGL